MSRCRGESNTAQPPFGILAGKSTCSSEHREIATGRFVAGHRTTNRGVESTMLWKGRRGSWQRFT